MSNTLSKDKEDILNERSLIFYMGSGEDEVEGSKDKVFEAMDEYAQQEAIGFAEWIQHDYVPYIDSRWVHEKDKASKKKFTTEELYNLYIKSKTPTKP